MANTSRQTLAITGGVGEVIFIAEVGPTGVDLSHSHNFVDISTAISPTAGSFSLYVESAENSGFKRLVDNSNANISTIDATKTGAQVADGEALGWSFNGNPYRIKVVATAITGVTDVDVVVTQNVS